MIINVCASSVSHDAPSQHAPSQNYYFTDDEKVAESTSTTDASSRDSMKETSNDVSAPVVESVPIDTLKYKKKSVHTKIFRTIRNLMIDSVKK
uniref:Uncharacterized protein n=1 Tax=Ascaris lumbricoides TaxID=6252 RepID=A0A0M3I9F6_ASCLU